MKPTHLLLIGILLLLMGATGFFLGIAVTAGGFNLADFEFPLSHLESIAVADDGRLFCGLGFYDRIQVYDENGRFLKNWFCDSSQGGCNLRVEGDKLIVTTWLGKRRYYYDLDGNLLRTENGYSAKPEFPRPNIDRLGNEYAIEGNIFGPEIVKRNQGAAVFRVHTPWRWWWLQYPFPGWLIFISGLALVIAAFKLGRRERSNPFTRPTP